MRKNFMKFKTTPILGVVFIMFIFLIQPHKSFGQSKFFNGFTGGVGLNGTIEYNYPTLGFSTDVFLRKKVYKKIGLSVNWHRAKVQRSLFGNYPSHWLDFGTVDTYAQQFIGKSVDYFFSPKGTSFVINATTFDLNIDYEFGKKKNKIVPAFGFSCGISSEAKLYLRGISYSNGIIRSASSQSKFQRNFVYGINLSIADQYWINDDLALFFKAKMILTRPRAFATGPQSVAYKGDSFYESRNFGFGIIKKLNKNQNKTKKLKM